MGCYRTENVCSVEEMFVHCFVSGYEIGILARIKKASWSLSTDNISKCILSGKKTRVRVTGGAREVLLLLLVQ